MQKEASLSLLIVVATDNASIHAHPQQERKIRKSPETNPPAQCSVCRLVKNMPTFWWAHTVHGMLACQCGLYILFFSLYCMCIIIMFLLPRVSSCKHRPNLCTLIESFHMILAYAGTRVDVCIFDTCYKLVHPFHLYICCLHIRIYIHKYIFMYSAHMYMYIYAHTHIFKP